MDKHFLGNFSTLPRIEEGVFHHSQLIFEVDMLPSTQSLFENVSHLLFSRYVLQLNSSPLNIISDEVIYDLSVFRPVMEYCIVRELDATLVVTLYNCRPQLLIKQVNHQLVKPQCLTTSLTGCHILGLCRTQSNKLLIFVEPRHCYLAQTKATTESSLLV